MRRCFLIFLLIPGLLGTWVEDVLQDMTLDEKIGQLLMLAVPCNPDSSTSPDRLFTLQLPTYLNKGYAERMIRDYHVGGILYICEGTMQEQVEATNAFQQQSKFPLLIAQDLEPGLVRLTDIVNYPRARTLGSIGDQDLTYRIGKHIGLQAHRLGVHVVFAPVVDVQTNENNPIINTRSFGSSADHVSAHGRALMKGLQEVGVIACAKHFPGHGDTSVDSHTSLPVVDHDSERLEAIELAPFKALIDAGVDAIMPGHLLVTALDADWPASLSPVCIKEVLRKKLGFKGLVFTDALIMKALNEECGSASLQALMAGSTMAVFPDDIPQAHARIKQAVCDGEFPLEEVDAKVRAVLKTKERLGLHEHRMVNVENLAQEVCSDEAVQLAQIIGGKVQKLI